MGSILTLKLAQEEQQPGEVYTRESVERDRLSANLDNTDFLDTVHKCTSGARKTTTTVV